MKPGILIHVQHCQSTNFVVLRLQGLATTLTLLKLLSVHRECAADPHTHELSLQVLYLLLQLDCLLLFGLQLGLR